MTARELMRTLANRGVRLCIAGDKLRAHAPIGVLTPELRGLLTARKPEILDVLRHDEHVQRCMDEHDCATWCVAVWPSAEKLATLPGPVAALARERTGWSASAWSGRLLTLAIRCQGLHPGRAAELRAAAQVLMVG